ncbi:3-oxoacyl-ACP reductase family protein [Sphingopyxis terrae]|uniref:3-oxoacyl-ACP reductase family protein n=1 Tax=Sphingopyxis terrae TaxID=33052 RepID=UPI00078771EF|nr:3-oxoacyl-ACP reductase family protein [Sphingopyxis terrae]
MADPISLSGKLAVITGGTRGIGLAISETLAAHGASVVINTHANEALASDLARRLATTYGVETDYVVGDVAFAQTADQLARKAFGLAKRLDIYVNNAGIMRDGLIGMVPQQDVDAVIGVNLEGVIHGTQAAARAMRRGGGGSIINISSIMGRVGNSGQLVYSAAKAGVLGATKAAAKELAPLNIRVNAIAPGFIATDLTAQLAADKVEEKVRNIAINRVGQPQDVANLALFLASEMASYITGQVIGVDGGMLV